MNKRRISFYNKWILLPKLFYRQFRNNRPSLISGITVIFVFKNYQFTILLFSFCCIPSSACAIICLYCSFTLSGASICTLPLKPNTQPKKVGLADTSVCKIIPFRSIDIFENAVSAGTGNFLVDGPKETVCIDESILPEDTTFGVRISGDSMEPEFHDGQIAWVLQQESVANGEIGIFALNGEAYIKKLQNDKDGIFLISLNEKYAPIKVSENDRLDIFGKVLGKSDASAITGHYR